MLLSERSRLAVSRFILKSALSVFTEDLSWSECARKEIEAEWGVIRCADDEDGDRESEAKDSFVMYELLYLPRAIYTGYPPLSVSSHIPFPIYASWPSSSLLPKALMRFTPPSGMIVNLICV